MARIVALVAVVALAATPAAALAALGQEPIVPAPQEQGLLQDPAAQPPVQQAPAPTAPAPEEDDGFVSRGQLLLIGLAIAGLIAGIWIVIARDARRITAGRTHGDALPAGGSATRAARRSRKLSAAEKRRRKRGRAR